MSQPKRRAVLSASKSVYVSPNRGLPLLDEAIEQIELHSVSPRGQWYQGDWRCESGMCLAGWIDQLAGGEWLSPAGDDFNSDLLVPEPEDDADELRRAYDGYDYVPGREGVPAMVRAVRLIGLSWEQYSATRIWGDIFSGENTLEMIKGIRDELAETVYAANDND